MDNNIKQIRKSLGISVTELARKLNMSQGNLSKIENGQVDMKTETAVAIAEILQCPLEKLFAEEKSSVSPLAMPLNLPADSRTVMVWEDNMAPTLTPGDIAVVRPCRIKGPDGIYLLKCRGKEILRRLQTLTDGSVAVLCDNQGYRPETATAELEISGRVISKIVLVPLS